MRGGEFEGRMVDEAGEVVGQIFEDHETFVFLNHDFLERNDVTVAEVLEEFDFSDCSDWKAVSFAFHADLFESDEVFGEDVNCFEDFAVGAGADDGFVAWFAVVDRVAGGHFWGEGWFEFLFDAFGRR